MISILEYQVSLAQSRADLLDASRCLSRIGQKNLWAKKFVGKKMGWQKDGMADRVNPITDPDVNAFIFLPFHFFALFDSRSDRPTTGKKRAGKNANQKRVENRNGDKLWFFHSPFIDWLWKDANYNSV
ncbi:MAG: hypothetical protein ACOYKN_04970 [Pirellula sp.]